MNILLKPILSTVCPCMHLCMYLSVHQCTGLYEGLTMRVVAAAVLWRENERTGSGDRSDVSLCEERYGGPGGHTEQGSWCVGPSAAGRQRCTGGVTEGARGHGDWLTWGILLRVTLGGNLLAGHTTCTQPLLQILLHRRGAGCHACHAGCDDRTAVIWTGRHGPRRRQVYSDVPDIDGQSDDCVWRF